MPINCHVAGDDSNGEEHFEKLYVKRLSWFKIDMPIGSYNSDWALVKNNQQEKKTKKARANDSDKAGTAATTDTAKPLSEMRRCSNRSEREIRDIQRLQ